MNTAIHNRPGTRNVARRPHRLQPIRPARTIEHRRRPAPVDTTVTPVTPILRFDDEPMFVGSHLEAQLMQRQWRWW